LVTTLCRDCVALTIAAARSERCGECGSPRQVCHATLDTLSIAHVDCDAFYATVEKRDRPDLADRPVIIGGGSRGVVLACCYVARLYGVRSAIPMFKALAACPDAVVIRPDMAKYRDVGRAVRAEMLRLTPLVEPLSIDEAFLDLGGTQELHGACPPSSSAHSPFASKPSSGSPCRSVERQQIPRQARLRSRQAARLCGARPQRGRRLPRRQAGRALVGVGAAMQRRLAGDGITLIGQLAVLGERALAARYGRVGARLGRLARGGDARAVDAHAPVHSISAETTLGQDEADAEGLAHALWPLCERVSARLKQASLATGTITLKLKTGDFRLRTRSRRLADPTQLAETLFRTASFLFASEADGVTRFRLIGVGADKLTDSREADPPTLFDRELDRPRRLERAMDQIRGRLGEGSVQLGRGMPAADDGSHPMTFRRREG
jgi:DNA polymerase IV